VDYAYAAHTERCTYLLDAEGVCKRVIVANPRVGERTMGGRLTSEAARMCVGAQYVASIDPRAEGCLVPLPRPGAQMLFAYAGPDGRLAIVRTAALTRFDALGADESQDRTFPSLPSISAITLNDWTDEDVATIPMSRRVTGNRPAAGGGMIPRRRTR
jgi:hypothetical protein